MEGWSHYRLPFVSETERQKERQRKGKREGSAQVCRPRLPIVLHNLQCPFIMADRNNIASFPRPVARMTDSVLHLFRALGSLCVD